MKNVINEVLKKGNFVWIAVARYDFKDAKNFMTRAPFLIHPFEEFYAIVQTLCI